MSKSGNFLDAIHDKRNDIVRVWERDGDVRRVVEYPAPYYFYVPDPSGTYRSAWGDRLTKITATTHQEFEQLKRQYRGKHESDIRVQAKVLMDHYYDRPAPGAHVTFLDIEVDYIPGRFGSTQDPYAPINALTLCHQWSGKFKTFAIPPAVAVADGRITQEYLDKITEEFRGESEISFYPDERSLLIAFLDEIQDSDVLSGWNSQFFDMPYIALRIEEAIGPTAVKRLCFDGAMPPRWGEAEHFGDIEKTITLSGRHHLDYMDVFKKFNLQGRDSWSLANISADELPGMEKLEYEGDLASLYVNDFRWFVRYNIRDVEVLHELENKFKYMQLADELSHMNTVPVPKVLGSVNIIDTGIINYCHNDLDVRVRDKHERVEIKVEGALVLMPRRGRYRYVGSVDIGALYPSTIRSLNMSPEKLIGQFAEEERAWHLIRARSDQDITFILEADGSEMVAPARDWIPVLLSNKWAVSSFGTVFDQGSGEGFIPGVLRKWITLRKQFKKEMDEWKKKLKTLEKGTPEYDEADYWVGFYDRKQGAYKVLNNSTYGSIINAGCKFYDHRMGASTTGTGRQITTHMMKTVGFALTGREVTVTKRAEEKSNGRIEYIYETDNEAIIYGDTDSNYFHIAEAKSVEEAVLIADTIEDVVNAAFQPFMRDACLCQPGFDNLVSAGREVVTDGAMFLAKKKYVCRVVDKEGFATDEIKAMGSEIKKSDTPKYIRGFLKELTDRILKYHEKDEITEYVLNFREELLNTAKANPAIIGVTKSANNLTGQYERWTQIEKDGRGKLNLPGHIRAAINHNECVKHFGDKVTRELVSGAKVRIFYVKPNQFGYNSIAVSSDTNTLPSWFLENFTIDVDKMENKLIDMKIGQIFAALGWCIPTYNSVIADSILGF